MERSLIACLTCDVEIQGRKGMRQFETILRLLNDHGVKGTFFLLISSESYPYLEEFDVSSHLGEAEFGLHVHWGESNRPETSQRRGLSSLSIDILEKEVVQGQEYCKDLGFTPKSFRGGGLCQTTRALTLINRHGFQVDSSVAPKLNEEEGWFQNHGRVPYRSWYFPSKKGYDIPSSRMEERVGILEIPVTRLIPSLRSWFPYTLEPETPLYKIITNQWILRSYLERPLLISPIFHSWGAEHGDFPLFLRSLTRMMLYMKEKKLKPLTLNEAHKVINETYSSAL